MRHALAATLATAVAAGLASSAHAGTFASITVDGTFTDWDAVPVAAIDAGGDNAGSLDFTQLKVANDATNLYALFTFAEPVNPNGGPPSLFTAIDSDNDTATGFDVFGLGLIGSNAAYQNDFPFTQDNGSFNSGGTLVNSFYDRAPVGTVTTQQEISIPLSLTQAGGGFNGSVFPGTFGLLFYTDSGAGDVIGPVTYTLGTPGVVPEPATAGLLVAAVAGMALRRRRA